MKIERAPEGRVTRESSVRQGGGGALGGKGRQRGRVECLNVFFARQSGGLAVGSRRGPSRRCAAVFDCMMALVAQIVR